VSPGEAVTAGSFLGEKLILNEFVAFTDFGPRVEELSDKTVAVVTFALCGFANLGSFAILLGGLAQIAPSAAAPSPAWASAPCSPAPWPTSSTPPWPGCSSRTAVMDPAPHAAPGLRAARDPCAPPAATVQSPQPSDA
jgi:Na+ dependent nucleoside transporter C-terminus